MGWLIELLKTGALPQEVSFIFTIIVIFGFVFLFFKFLMNLWKYYWETMRPMIKQENTNKSEEEDSGDVFRMIVNIHEKIGKMTSDYAGKYATKEDLEDLRKKIDKAIETLSNIKGQLGM